MSRLVQKSPLRAHPHDDFSYTAEATLDRRLWEYKDQTHAAFYIAQCLMWLSECCFWSREFDWS